MNEELKVTKMGKLRIYVMRGEAVKGKSLFRKMFPKNKYMKIMQEAQSSGIKQAHIFHTHATVKRGGRVAHHLIHEDISDLAVCIELVDDKAKLQAFFSTHKDMLKENTIIYKEVEFWEYL